MQKLQKGEQPFIAFQASAASSLWLGTLSVCSPALLIVSGISQVGTKKVQQFLNGNVVSACCFQDTLTQKSGHFWNIFCFLPQVLGLDWERLVNFFCSPQYHSEARSSSQPFYRIRFTHLLIQQLFIENPLCNRHFFRYQRQ